MADTWNFVQEFGPTLISSAALVLAVAALRLGRRTAKVFEDIERRLTDLGRDG